MRMPKITKDGFLEASVFLENNTLQFKDECAGKVIKSKYGGKEFAIHFPNFKRTISKDPKNKDPTFEGTKIAFNWLVNNPSEFASCYGYSLDNYQKFDFRSKRIVIRSLKPLSKDEAVDILKLLSKWKDEFIAWLEVVEFRSFNDDHRLITVTNQEIGYLVKKDKPHEYLESGTNNIDIKWDQYAGISIESIKKTVKLGGGADIP